MEGNSNQEVRLKLMFDEPSLRREADKGMRAVNQAGGAGGVVGGGVHGTATTGGGQWGARAAGTMGAVRSGAEAFVAGPGEAILKAAEKITVAGAKSVGGPWGEGIAQTAIGVVNAAADVGQSALERYSRYNGDMAMKAADLQFGQIEHDITMAGSPVGAAEADAYITRKKLLWALEEAGADPAAAAKQLFGTPGQDLTDESASGGLTSAQKANIQANLPAHASTPSPSGMFGLAGSTVNISVEVRSEEDIRRMTEQVRQTMVDTLNTSRDQTRLLAMQLDGRNIGGLM